MQELSGTTCSVRCRSNELESIQLSKQLAERGAESQDFRLICASKGAIEEVQRKA